MLIMSRKSVLHGRRAAAAANAPAIVFGEFPLWPEDSDLIEREEPVPDMGLAEEPMEEYADADMGAIEE